MKCLLKICLVFVANAAFNVGVMGAPVNNEAEATITSYDYRLTEDGYVFEYSTSNGLTRKEIGTFIKDPNDDDNTILRVIGSYSYIDDKGEIQEFQYGGGVDGSSFRKSAVGASSVLSSPLGEEFVKLNAYQPKGISSAALASLSG